MARIFGKYELHCNGIDSFVALMGNFNWGPISRNDIVSTPGSNCPPSVILYKCLNVIARPVTVA